MQAHHDARHQRDETARPDWYLNAVIYEVNVATFQDSNGDGIGDFRGLTSRLDYICDLGVDCVWLQPFYASPKQDNGYDVADYCSVDAELGSMEDFDAFVRAAVARGLRVIADLPLNHTSTQHTWFQAARSSRTSPFRSYYIWTDELPANPSPYPVFGPDKDGNWEWDDVAGQYYFHTFYGFQPDLNLANPRVQEELLGVARFWMRRGLHGFRLDAVPFLIHDTSEAEHLEEPHAFLKALRRVVNEERPDGVLVAEANQKPHEMRRYFGDGDEMQLLLNFYLCNHLFLALATQRAEPIRRAWSELPRTPPGTQWANFLRNHDELSLDQLTDEERERVFEAFAPKEHMQAFGRGVRRRLAPMMDGDARRIRQAYSLLFSLPGTPVVNAGEELGLGDDLSLPEREAARTPMQWTGGPGAGFTDAPASALERPVIESGPYRAELVNVERQQRDPHSLLSFFREAIAAYHRHPPFGGGQWSFLPTEHEGVLAHCMQTAGQRAYAVHNLTAQPATVRIADVPARLRDCLADDTYGRALDGTVTVNAYGYRWLIEEETNA